MSDDTSLLLTIFVGIAAVALLLQGFALLGLLFTARRLQTRIDELAADLGARIGPLSEKLDQILGGVRTVVDSMEKVQAHVTATSEVVHNRMVEIDGFVAETTDAARKQMVKIQHIVDHSSLRLEETFDLIQKGMLTPISEATALIRGLKAGLHFFFRGSGRPVSPTHQDEEMFI